jgi:hypothetical protein
MEINTLEMKFPYHGIHTINTFGTKLSWQWRARWHAPVLFFPSTAPCTAVAQPRVGTLKAIPVIGAHMLCDIVRLPGYSRFVTI